MVLASTAGILNEHSTGRIGNVIVTYCGKTKASDFWFAIHGLSM